ncbi:MAG: MBL fold metallo-hydrolase [Bacteroidota bacterium]
MVHLIDLNFQLPKTIASFVVPSDAGPILIETGPHSVFPILEKGLADLGYKVSDIKHVLLSHIHFDHAGAAWALAEAGATIYVHPRGWKHMHDPSRLYESAKRIYQDKMEELWGEMHAIPAEQLMAIEDGITLNLGGHEFTALHTPGHANHHIAWKWNDTVFTGDVAGCRIEGGPIVPPCPPPDINLEAWEASIDRILSHEPQRLFLTHFGEVTDVADHFAQLKEILKDWGAWIKPHWEAGKSAGEITSAFQAYADAQLAEQGADAVSIARYNAANPAWMSVAGLMRYWQKKSEGAF